MIEEYPRRVLREAASTTSAGGAYDDVAFREVPHGEQWWVQEVTATDENNGSTKIGVFVRTRYGDFWVNERAFTTAAERRRLECKVWLRENERLIVRFTGATQADTLKAWLTGTYEEVGEQVGAPTRFGEM